MALEIGSAITVDMSVDTTKLIDKIRTRKSVYGLLSLMYATAYMSPWLFKLKDYPVLLYALSAFFVIIPWSILHDDKDNPTWVDVIGYISGLAIGGELTLNSIGLYGINAGAVFAFNTSGMQGVPLFVFAIVMGIACLTASGSKKDQSTNQSSKVSKS